MAHRMNALMPRDVPARVKLRVEDFMLLDAAGKFTEIGRTELIDGDIIEMNSQHRPHSRAKFRLARLIEDALVTLDSPLGVLVEATVNMPPHDAPEPDIVVTSEPKGEGFVPLATVALLVEVADTTLSFDLGRKATLYARRGVPEYWVVDLNAARIVRMWRPGPAGFAESDATPFGAPLKAATISALIVATGGLA